MSSLSRKAFTADGERTPKLLVFAAAKAKFFSLLKMFCDWLEINLKSSVARKLLRPHNWQCKPIYMSSQHTV